MRKLLLLAALLLIPTLASAQTTIVVGANQSLLWEHPGTNVDTFLLCVDASPCVDVGKVTVPTVPPVDPARVVYGASLIRADIAPLLPVGPHSLVVRASFQGQTANSPALAVTVTVVESPSNLRIGEEETDPTPPPF